jgi:hypothetical protein
MKPLTTEDTEVTEKDAEKDAEKDSEKDAEKEILCVTSVPSVVKLL